jgi:hypothetical protein
MNKQTRPRREHTPEVREAIIQTVIGNMALSGVHITREMAEASYEKTMSKPLIEL